MVKQDRPRIAIIGAGNVAWHMSRALSAVADVVQIAATSLDSAQPLADELNRFNGSEICSAADGLSGLFPDCDLYLIAVRDDAVAAVADNTPDFSGVWAHTSGSVSLYALAGKSRRGVFYPLQTFTRGVPVDFRRVPMLIEGSDEASSHFLTSLARQIAGETRTVDSAKREAIHVAAVFACNFANLMWADADRLLRDAGLDLSLMHPLLQATLDKLEAASPVDAMTGPARRGDTKVIQRHLKSLPADLKPVYEMLTDNIRKLYSCHNE